MWIVAPLSRRTSSSRRACEQRHRTAESDHGELQQGGTGQQDEAELDGADALRAGLQRVVHGVRAVVAVRPTSPQQQAFGPAGTLVSVAVARFVAMAVAVVVVVTVIGAGHRGLPDPRGRAAVSTAARCAPW